MLEIYRTVSRPNSSPGPALIFLGRFDHLARKDTPKYFAANPRRARGYDGRTYERVSYCVNANVLYIQY